MSWLRAVTFIVSVCVALPASAAIDIVMGYLERQIERPPTLSNLDPVPEDEGLAGARLGTMDNATTGSFMGHNYQLEVAIVPEGDDLIAAARDLAGKTQILVVNAPADDVHALADLPELASAIIFNAGSADNDLRSGGCRANVLHTLPSRAMLSDALAQFAVQKRWRKWALISGPMPGDQLFAASLEKSAHKFNVRIVGRKDWSFASDMRRTAGQEVPLFTQELDDHDLLVIADERNDYARYILYNSWIPRPVAGSDGLVASAWSSAVEQYGAAQLQSRFQEHHGRAMRSVDYAAWAAVRTIGEAVTRTNQAEIAPLRDYILSEAFQLAGFKGRPLSFRDWNGQLRQPVPLSHPGALVSMPPLPEFLHQGSEMDTLGLDRPESRCEAFQ